MSTCPRRDSGMAGTAAIILAGWSGDSILTGMGSTRGGLTFLHGSIGISSSSSASSSTILRLT